MLQHELESKIQECRTQLTKLENKTNPRWWVMAVLVGVVLSAFAMIAPKKPGSWGMMKHSYTINQNK